MMLFTFLVFSGWRIGEVEAMRPLHGGEQWAERNGLLRQSLQAGRCHHLVPVRAHTSLDREEAGAP